MVKRKFPVKLVDHKHFNGLNDSVGCRNVMKFHEAGRFWLNGLRSRRDRAIVGSSLLQCFKGTGVNPVSATYYSYDLIA